MRHVSRSPLHDLRTRRQHRRVDRSLRLVGEPPHRRVHQLLQEALQPRAVDGCDGLPLAGRRPEQPDDCGDVAAQLEHRARPIGVRGGRFQAGRLDRIELGWLPARAPHLPATRRELRAQRAATAAAADDQRASQLLIVLPALRERTPASGPERLVLPGLPLHIGLGYLLCAALSPQRILRLDHLTDVVDLVLGLDLRRPGRLPVEEVGDAVPFEDTRERDHDQERRTRSPRVSVVEGLLAAR